MAVIESTFDTYALNSGTGFFNKQDMDNSILAYWGTEAEEKKMVLPFWKADELMNNSKTNQIALELFNLGDKNLVKGDWNSYSDSRQKSFWERILSFFNPISSPEAYYLIGTDLFPLTGFTGFKFNIPHQNMAIVARIGKNPSGEIEVIFIVANLDLKQGIPGGGSGGRAAGARLPSNQ